MDSQKRQEEEVMNTGRQSSCSFQQVYGLFYVPTETQDQQLNIPTRGQLVVHWCSVRCWLNDSQDQNNGTMAEDVAL